jgi:hypothetical protein
VWLFRDAFGWSPRSRVFQSPSSSVQKDIKSSKNICLTISDPQTKTTVRFSIAEFCLILMLEFRLTRCSFFDSWTSFTSRIFLMYSLTYSFL